ncbi:Coiled-coil domain containing protein 151 [Carabus blaptoides fortunei]
MAAQRFSTGRQRFWVLVAVRNMRTYLSVGRQGMRAKAEELANEKAQGQRKAAFEEFETKRKHNSSQITKLKKDIGELTITLQENKDNNAKYRVRSLKLESIAGPLNNKSTEQVIHILDLQIIDQKKHLDLIKHKIKTKETLLAKLASEYQMLLAEKSKNEQAMKKDNPVKKKINALQNQIHRVEVQWREAEHVRKSYRTIRASLLKDRAKFESTLKQLEERLEVQQRDIQQLQKVNGEAIKTRAAARGKLEREERTAMNSGKIRERQSSEYKNMVTDRKLELERLERKIFQSGKMAPPRPDTADDTEQTDDMTQEEDQEVVLNEAFDKLKEATGASTSDDVLGKFRAQKDTRTRLDYLKKTTELEKRQLELKQRTLSTELERYKYAQERDKEKHSEAILELKRNIDEQREIKRTCEESTIEQRQLVETICKMFYRLYVGLKEIGIKPSKEITDNPKDREKLTRTLYEELHRMVKRSEQIQETEETKTEELYPSDDDVVPPSYNALLRRTPLPVQGHSVQIAAPPITLSEDEGEVPSRGFLKRQAQLVVDAKSRRKNLRVPMRK